MAELRPYDPSKPWISVNLPTKEELIAATLGLIPWRQTRVYTAN